MSLTLDHPLYLLLLLLLPLAAPAWSRPRAPLRALVVALAALALASPILRLPERRLSVVAAIDVSESVAPDSLATTLQQLEALERQAGKRLQFVAFAAEARPVESAAALLRLPVLEGGAAAPKIDVDRTAGGAQALDRRDTDLEAAVEAALARFDPAAVPRLLLITDGHSTRGQLERAVERLQARGVRVFAHASAVAPSRTPRLRDLRAVGPVRAGAPARLLATLLVPEAGRVHLALRERDTTRALAAATLDAKSGDNEVVLEPTFARPGTAELTLSLTASPQESPQESADEIVYPVTLLAGEAHRVLYVEGHAASAHYLAGALAGQGLEVQQAGAADLPRDPAALTDFDAVILSDVPATDLDARQMAALERWVREDGGGLLFAAGESTFGEQGYTATTLERLLPLRFAVEEERSDVALVIVLDKSYSMRGDKIALAKAASAAALDVLQDDHRFGLVAFDWNPTLVVPLRFARERESIKALIARIEATAQTNFFPALEMAYEKLRAQPAKTKHVILLSDGKTYPDAYQTLLLRMRAEEITVSTVGVGEEADRELLAQIAEWGGGRSYFLEDASRIVSVLVEEAESTLQDTVVERETRVSAVPRSPVLAGLPMADVPPLLGHVTAQRRDRAEVWLETEGLGRRGLGGASQPLLASWQYGLGRTTMFTSDVKNRWGLPWLAWPGYAPLFGQVVRDLAGQHPSARAARLDFRLARHQDRVVLELLATDSAGAWRNGLRPRVRCPAGSFELPQAAPGIYRLELGVSPQPTPLAFELEVDGERVAQRWLLYPESDERMNLAPDLELLHELATSTGGRFGGALDGVLEDTGERVPVRHELWPWLVLFALLAFLTELLLRRWPWGARDARPASLAMAASVLLLLGAAPGAALGGDSSAELDAALAALWSVAFDPQSTEQQAAVARVLGLAPSFDELHRRLAEGKAYPALPPGVIESSQRVGGQEHHYALVIPEGYDGKPTAVRIVLHGGVSTTDRRAGARGPIERLARHRYATVLPSAWQDSQWWQASQIENLELLLRRLKRDLNVDENRISLGGISDGAAGVYFAGMRDSTAYAHLLVFIGYLKVLAHVDADGQLHATNLRNRALFAVNTGNDPLYPFGLVEPTFELLRSGGIELVAHQQPDHGHNTDWWPAERESIDRFVEQHPRQPHPERLTWATERTDRYARHHWLLITELGAAAGESELADLNGAPGVPLFPRRRPFGRVDLERWGNLVLARSSGVRAFRLLLSTAAFDFTKPLQVEVNGSRVLEATVTPDPEVLLRRYLEDLDRTQLYAAEIAVHLPPRSPPE